jgi:hypothetical protein
MSAPSSSGRWPSGEAKVLSTTRMGRSPRAPRWSARRSRDGGDVDHLQVRVGRRLEPDQPRALVERLVEGRAGIGRQVVIARLDARLAHDPLEVAIGAAVDVVGADDALAGQGQRGDYLGGGRAAGEGQSVARALERRDRSLEPRSRGVARARVLPPAARPADGLLGVGRRLVDRRRDGAGQLVGRHAGVDGERVRSPVRIGLVGSVGRRRL